MGLKLFILFIGILSTFNSYGLKKNERHFGINYPQNVEKQVEIAEGSLEKNYTRKDFYNDKEKIANINIQPLAENKDYKTKSYINIYKDVYLKLCTTTQIAEEAENFNKFRKSQEEKIEVNNAYRTVELKFKNFEGYENFLKSLKKTNCFYKIARVFEELSNDLVAKEMKYMNIIGLTNKQFFDEFVETFYFKVARYSVAQLVAKDSAFQMRHKDYISQVMAQDSVDLYVFIKK